MSIRQQPRELPHGSDFNVETIQLASKLNARDSLGILIMQPMIAEMLIFENRWKWKDGGEKSNQLSNLQKLMDLAQDSSLAGHNTETDIVIIPEYGIPGIEGLEAIKKRLIDSSIQNQIVIGGLDGIARSEYIDLLDDSSLSTSTKSNIERAIHRAQWVNSAVIIEKADQAISVYLQPKFLPAAEEDNTSMCLGNQLLVFKTSPVGEFMPALCFFVPICFDWIGRQSLLGKLDSIVDQIKAIGRNASNAFWLIPVIQHNPQPYHQDFMGSTSYRLTSNMWRDVYDQRACVIMANTASPDGIRYGQSAFIYPGRNESLKQLARHTATSKKREFLSGCVERRFRENAPVIHSVHYVPSTATSGCSGDPRDIFREAKLLCLDNSLSLICSRRWPLTETAICAYSKVLGDYLDRASSDLEKSSEGLSDLRAVFRDNINRLVTIMRGNNSDKIKNKMKLLCRWDSYSDNCDNWEFDNEGRALENLVREQSIFSIAYDSFESEKLYHGVFSVNDRHHALMMIDGNQQKGHIELEREIAEGIKSGSISPKRVDSLVVIGNTFPEQVFRRHSLLGQPQPGSITDVPMTYIPSSNILTDVSECFDLVDLTQRINKRLEVS